MQTRIKVTEFADGSVEYQPQYKGWLFWHSFQIFYWDFSVPRNFESLKQAQEFILRELELHNAGKKVRVTHIKYP